MPLEIVTLYRHYCPDWRAPSLTATVVLGELFWFVEEHGHVSRCVATCPWCEERLPASIDEAMEIIIEKERNAASSKGGEL